MARAFSLSMVTKIIEFVKSTAFILGYLFAIASAYYLSFWGYFDIDVFQFISVEDIIKGIAYPLRFADVGIIGIFVFFVALYTFIAMTKFKGGLFWFVLGILVFFLIFSAYVLFYFKYKNASPWIGIGLATLLTALLSVIYIIIDDAYEMDRESAVSAGNTFTDEHPSVNFRNIIISFSLIFFPINAIIAGQANARDIHDGKRFNYVMKNDLPNDKIVIRYDYLVFLGAISEKYIFINKNENERFVFDKEELQSLRINHFNVENKFSVNQLADNLRIQGQKAHK